MIFVTFKLGFGQNRGISLFSCRLSNIRINQKIKCLISQRTYQLAKSLTGLNYDHLINKLIIWPVIFPKCPEMSKFNSGLFPCRALYMLLFPSFVPTSKECIDLMKEIEEREKKFDREFWSEICTLLAEWTEYVNDPNFHLAYSINFHMQEK